MIKWWINGPGKLSFRMIGNSESDSAYWNWV